MRHFFVMLAAPVVTAALLAQSPNPSASKPSPDPSSTLCTVAGRVVTAADGNPLKSARVMLIPEHPHSENEMYASSSDGDGRFTLKGIPAGSYRFFATHTGFVQQHYKSGVGDTGPLFSLKPGEKVQDVLFRLIAAAVITGRLINEDGEPMQGVQVVALQRPTEEDLDDLDSPHPQKIEMETVKATESDDRGQYRIFGLKPGEYFIKAIDSPLPAVGVVDESYWAQQSLGSDYGPVYYPGATQLSQAQVVPVKAGEEGQADITMRRVKTAEIAGRVAGAISPGEKVIVMLDTFDGEGDLNRQDTTDEKGNFHFRNVPAGTYYLVALQRQEGNFYDSRARQKIEVSGENIDGLTVSLGSGVTIQGRIKSNSSTSISFDRVHLTLMPVDEDGLAGGGEVKKDGSFEFKSVHEGSYSIGVWGLEKDTYLKSVRHGSDDIFEKGVQVEEDSSARIEITLGSDGAKLDGSVKDDDGPVIGARVRLVPDPLTPYNHLRIYRTSTDQAGHFVLTNIAPGKYKLTARPMRSSEKASYKAEPQAIALSENDHQTAEIKLEKPQE